MDKKLILSEITRTAATNGGKPLGTARFEAETGIKTSDWLGVYWARWGDAVCEAGLAPNRLRCAFEDEHVFAHYARYAKELGRLPTRYDLRLKRRRDSSFPSFNVFSRFGSKADLINKLRAYCRPQADLEGVTEFCEEYLRTVKPATEEGDAPSEGGVIGDVYLFKSGRFYKIGKSNSAGRREYEMSIQLPERTKTVHVIRTDDPSGLKSIGTSGSRPSGRMENGST